jgi:molybdate transport system substrate-binding protein
MLTYLISKTYRSFSALGAKLLAMILILSSPLVSADSLNIAVASNFAPAMEAIKQAFERQSGHQLKLIRSSSGKLYAQISNGAPFDLFLSADQQRPQRLEQEGRSISGSRQTYAMGRLVLWSGAAGLSASAALLESGDKTQKIAIANPKLAPYGKAAMEVLSALNLLEQVQTKAVWGENVGQTFQFAFSGGAEAGFVAYSQALAAPESGSSSYWLIPDSLYQPIRQDMVLLTDSIAGRELVEFMRGEAVAEILLRSGYLLPQANARITPLGEP